MLAKNLAVSIVVTSIYWVPLLEHYFATSYEVFVPGRMQRLDILKELKLKFYELFVTTKEQIRIYEIGFVITLGMILTPFAYKKLNKEIRTVYLFFLISGIILSFMTLNIFPFEKLPSFLTMIQFSFRLLEFTSFFFAIISAINYGMIIKEIRIMDLLILSLIVILLTSTYVSKLDFNCKYNEKKLVENPVAFTESTGRVHAGMASMEYMPSKMFNNKEYVLNRKDEPIILNSEITKINNFKKNESKMSLELENVEEGTEIELPYTYYLGYRIYENGKKIEYTESDYGFIKITLDKNDKTEITVKYLGTNAMLIAFFTSIIGLAFLLKYIYNIHFL